MFLRIPIYDEKGCQECPHKTVDESEAIKYENKGIHICHMDSKKKCIGHALSEKLVSEGKKQYNGDIVRIIRT